METAIDAEATKAGIPVMAGKTVLVTGATGGIGKATAIGLARLGARVGITGRDVARAEAAAADIVHRGEHRRSGRVRRGPLLPERGTTPRA